MDIKISLPGEAQDLKDIHIMDNEGNLAQPLKLSKEAKGGPALGSTGNLGGKLTMSEAHGIDQSRAEYMRQMNLKELKKLQARKYENNGRIEKLQGNVEKLQNDLLIL